MGWWCQAQILFFSPFIFFIFLGGFIMWDLCNVFGEQWGERNLDKDLGLEWFGKESDEISLNPNYFK